MTETLTRAQYRTLTHAFSSLGDETLLLPTHGGGSFCSTGAGAQRTSVLGDERARNPLLRFEDEETFLEWFPSTFPSTPEYFFRMRSINQDGPRLRAEISPPPPLSPGEFEEARRHALVLDVRPIAEYMKGHVPGALSNEFRDAYATWLGWLAPAELPLLFVTGEAPLDRILDQSLLVGYERFAGHLAGGMEAWEANGMPVQLSELVDPAEARKALTEGVTLVDVREPGEFESGHIDGAISVPLGRIGTQLDLIPRDRPVLAYCGGGVRAASAISLLERAGFGQLLNLEGGMGAWREAGYPAV